MTLSPPLPPRDGVHYRACNLCEAICGLRITVQGGQVTDVRGDPDDPLSRGHICPKGAALADLHADPDRLKTPMRRDGDTWHPMSWDDALDLVARRLRGVQAAHGPDSVATFQGNPSVHNSGTLLTAGAFLKALGTRNRYSATSTDQLPHHYAAAEMFGHPLLLPIPDVDRTDFLLMLGANPLASNGSILTAPGMRERLRAIRERGGRVVLLDPRRTESAAHASEYHPIRPGSDALFLMALLQVILSEGLARPGRLADVTDGLEDLHDVAAPYTPEAVQAATGVPAATTRDLARAFARAPRAAAYGRIGLSVQAFGGLCQWLLNTLNLVTGNLDREGGAMVPRPAFDLLTGARPGQTHHGRWHSRVRGLPEFDGELPNAALAEEILTPGDGQIRALVTIAGNPVLSTPGGQDLDRALPGLDFMVSIDPYLNETTRHAHVILPPATGLEVEHYDVIFHHFAVRATARLNQSVFPISADQRFDHQIFAGLSERLSGKALATPAERLDAGLRHGPHRLTLDDVRAHPHGLDLGPMQPVLPERLLTASGRIQALPEPMRRDLTRLHAALSTPVAPLILIGRRQLRSNNSWMHNTPRLMRGPDRCTLQLNPADAGGLQDGQLATVTSRVGQVTVPVEITSDVMPGVASLPHGFGHARRGAQLRVAQAHPGVSLNDLTDPLLLDELTGNAVLNGTPIHVRPAPQVAGAAPAAGSAAD